MSLEILPVYGRKGSFISLKGWSKETQTDALYVKNKSAEAVSKAISRFRLPGNEPGIPPMEYVIQLHGLYRHIVRIYISAHKVIS